jgi:hypothetical protein
MKGSIKIKLNVRKPWEVSKGHSEHRSGSGCHESRPRRLRSRGDVSRACVREFE